LKRRKGELPGQFEVPLFVPAAGAIVCLVLIVVRVATGDWRAPALAGVLLCSLSRALRAGAASAKR